MNPNILLGIAIAHVTCMPGQRRTTVEIAAYADCSPSYIQKIEQKAMRKLRKRLAMKSDPVCAEICNVLFRK